MSNIAKHNITKHTNSISKSDAILSYKSRHQRIVEFVKALHNIKDVIAEEYDDIEKKSKSKPCKPFTDKMDGLASLYSAENNLYYWYVEHVN